MDVEVVKRCIDAFHLAKKIPAMMPELPKPLTPRHIHILEHVCSSGDEGIRISQIAVKMRSTMPSITRMVSELENEGYVVKQKNQSDRRACIVYPTQAGRRLFDIYGTTYHRKLAMLFSDIPDDDLRTTAATIQRIYTLMSENPITANDLRKAGNHGDGGSKAKSKTVKEHAK